MAASGIQDSGFQKFRKRPKSNDSPPVPESSAAVSDDKGVSSRVMASYKRQTDGYATSNPPTLLARVNRCRHKMNGRCVLAEACNFHHMLTTREEDREAEQNARRLIKKINEFGMADREWIMERWIPNSVHERADYSGIEERIQTLINKKEKEEKERERQINECREKFNMVRNPRQRSTTPNPESLETDIYGTPPSELPPPPPVMDQMLLPMNNPLMFTMMPPTIPTIPAIPIDLNMYQGFHYPIHLNTPTMPPPVYNNEGQLEESQWPMSYN